MRNYLFAALVGCFVVVGLAQSDLFQFTDANGRCWMCRSGEPCTPCTSLNNNPLAVPIPIWPPTCPLPDCNVESNRPVLFPQNDPRFYYQCAVINGLWTPTTMECQCGTYFDYEMQRCEFPWDWVPACANLPVPIPPPKPCEDTTLAPPITQPPVDTVPPQTTAPPCPCVPWIPCWCNPCAQMPCGNCNGCQG